VNMHGSRSGGRVAAALFLFTGIVLGACRSSSSDSSAQQEPADLAALRKGLAEEATPFLGRQAVAVDAVREVELVAAPSALRLLDGRELNVWAYNGQVPGPTIRVRVGERLRVRLINRLPQPTSIHWHGVRLPNGMDGVPGVTQPPIEPGESFLYDFVARDAGTFWFHPHLRGSEQLERGLYGVLIVEDENPPPVREFVWVLDDWLVDETGQIDPRFVTRHDLAHDGRWGNVAGINGEVRPRFSVSAGERVRIRLVNAANGRVFSPDFSALDAQIVAFDGLPTGRPLDVRGLELAPGNRADVELVTSASDSGKVLSILDRFTGRPLVLAELVVGSPSDSESGRPMQPQAGVVPEWSGTERISPDLVFRLNAASGGPFGIEWSMNGRPMRHDHSAAMSELHVAPYRLPVGRWAKLRFVNESARLHPMHLHGQFFKVLSRNATAVDEGHWRDTVLVHPREIVDIGLVPVDQGQWMLHCHVLEHQDSGMMTLIAVDPEASRSR
jgi:FtsP/CotA-like multicopper oxidase with cupredoxin domain